MNTIPTIHAKVNFRIILHFGYSLDVEDSGFVYATRERAIKEILKMNSKRVAYGLESEGSYVTLLEEHEDDGVFYTKHSTIIRLD